MKLINLFEQWDNTLEVPGFNKFGSVEVFRNPSRSEFFKLLREYKFLRALTMRNDDIICWDGEATWHDAIREYYSDSQICLILKTNYLEFSEVDFAPEDLNFADTKYIKRYIDRILDNINLQRLYGNMPPVIRLSDGVEVTPEWIEELKHAQMNESVKRKKKIKESSEDYLTLWHGGRDLESGYSEVNPLSESVSKIKMFHGTTSKIAEAIKDNGFNPISYFTTSYEDAQYYAATGGEWDLERREEEWEENFGEKPREEYDPWDMFEKLYPADQHPVVIEVALPTNLISTARPDDGADGALVFDTTIPASYIVAIHVITWDMFYETD